MTDESSLWKQSWAKPKRKMDWGAARRREEEKKQELREKFVRMKSETLEREAKRREQA